ncbi:sulfatase-like hydrolase/transferase [Coraliomargarita algicola]|uniref:Sulfatase-like hydrolase/transferase n=1 Tax=Coraliomargarita algicola TaxID=3092156 RepID=A0ABZ0RL68_9BACT|nr:sulfatase-like hydrolase/transferase [Coraliomargarita sp. J2-16]WPJ95994.1 sulfatase-like hydrolase/transferase [Coraliomargarita sp. J2-16]
MEFQGIYILMLAAVSLCSSVVAQAQSEAPRPNIVYLYVDDMGWGSIGANGQDERRAAGLANVLTPNIDRLAEAGVNFQRAYGATVCSPARSSQQTGFHQGHSYADRNDTDNAQKAMRAEDLTMGDVLKAAGYVTGYWGKWGYGASDSLNSPVLLNQQTLPHEHGYDYVLAELHHIRAHSYFQPTLWSYKPGDANLNLVTNTLAAYANNPDYPELPARQSDAAYPSTAYCDDTYAFAALDFVRTQAQQYNADGTPFFALFASQIPHSPYNDIIDLPGWDDAYDGDAEFAALSADSKQWAAMVTRIDAHLGNIIAALEDPNNDGDTSDSVADNTIVIFMSDNGGHTNNSRTELDANGGLKGYKTQIWEGGIRVPMVVRWPSKITASSTLQVGTDTQMVVDVTDLLPTFCDLAGVETPLGLDGVSIAPTLLSEDEQRPRDFIIHEAQPDRSIIHGDYKLVDDNGTLKLYDLVNDHDESTNIAGANATLAAELSTLLYGERVAEPQWFSITYHSWMGADGADASTAVNWSDYTYTNSLNSVTYQSDTGAPQLSWIAQMENTGGSDQTALADADLEFLGLEIKGASGVAKQIFDVNSHHIVGRNEIRVSAHGQIQLAGGTLESLRWLDLKEAGELSGHGKVAAACYNAGALTVIGGDETTVPASSGELLQNGGFESGSGHTYSSTDAWFNYGGDQSLDARNTINAQAGSYRGIVGVNGSGIVSSPAVDTGHTIQRGDVFTLEFYYAGASGWDLGSDTITASLYYEDGGEQTLASFEVTPTQNFSNGYDLSANNVINATPSSIGKQLFLRFESTTATNSEFAALDGITLSFISEAGVVPADRVLVIDGYYRETDTASVEIYLQGTGTAGIDYAQVQVTETATLSGMLAVTVDAALSPQLGDAFEVLTAASIVGRFTNPDDLVEGSDGTLFAITYSRDAVTLTVTERTSQGTPYSWLDQHGLVLGGDYESAALSNADGDNWLAWEEFIFGSDPNDGSSNGDFKILDVGETAPQLTWASAAGRVYDVLHSPDLIQAFSALNTESLAATPPQNSYTLPVPLADKAFYRIQAELE